MSRLFNSLFPILIFISLLFLAFLAIKYIYYRICKKNIAFLSFLETTWKTTWGFFGALGLIIGVLSFTSGMTLPDMLSIYIPSEGELSKKEMQTAFDVGSEFYDQGYYDKAIVEFLKINEHSSRYNDAQVKLHDSENMYREQLFDIADSYIEQNQFEYAIDILNYGKTVLGNSDPALIVKISSSKELYYKYLDAQVDELWISGNYLEALNSLNEMKRIFTDKDYDYLISTKENKINADYTEDENKAHTEIVFSKTNNYIENGDMIGAIEYLKSERNSVVDSKVVDSKLQDLYSAYREQVLISAKSALEDIGYKEAVDILKDSISIIGNDPVIENTIEDYLEYAPSRIWDWDYFSVDEGKTNFFVTELDNYKNTQYNVISSYTYDSIDTPIIKKDFRIDGRYKRLEGTIFRTYAQRDSSTSPWIKIYCDDRLVYEEIIDIREEPSFFSIDLTDVRILKIEFYTFYRWFHENATIGGISELLIYKK